MQRKGGLGGGGGIQGGPQHRLANVEQLILSAVAGVVISLVDGVFQISETRVMLKTVTEGFVVKFVISFPFSAVEWFLIR